MAFRPPPAERIYRVLLLMFPRDIQREDGDEMARFFADRLRSTAGLGARIQLWSVAIIDAVRHGIGARQDRAREDKAEAGHASPGWRWLLARFWVDARFGWRVYRKTPGVTLVALTAIALGIGANAALFGYANALFFRPLPASHPEQLVSLFHRSTTSDGYSSFSYPDYLELRDQGDRLSGLAAWSTIDLDLGRPAVERVPAQIVSGNYFDVIGVTAVQGRVFHASDDRVPDRAAVVVIGDAFWRRQLHGRADAVGLSIALNGRNFTIVGVAPGAFRGLDLASDPLLWVPLVMHQAALPSFRAFGTDLFANRGTHWLDLTGRLRLGVTTEQAAAQARAIAARQAEANPETNKTWTIALTSAQDGRLGPPVTRDVVRLTSLLLAVVGLVMVIVCANVANLLLARAAARRREFGVRIAIGAARAQVVRQMLTESVLLAGIGGAAGVVLAALAIAVLPSIDVTASLPGLEPHLDPRVLLAAVGLTLFTGVAFGLAPATQASSTAVVDALKRGTGPGARSRRWPLRHVLVVVQVAMSMVLLTGAALTLQTLQNLRSIPLGFEAANLWIANVDLAQEHQPPERGRAMQHELLERVQALPGVESAALGFITPFSGRRMANDVFWIPPSASGERRRTNVDINVVSGEYFNAMRIPLLRGRTFDATDRPGSPDVAIVNRAMAERLWPGGDAIGQRVWSWNPREGDRELRVVGIAEDGRYYRSWRTEARPFLFVPSDQWFQADMALHVRAAQLTPAELLQAIASVTPDVPVPNPRMVADAMNTALALERTGARVLAAFGLLALVIAGIGVYSMMAFTVGQQTQEIGIRLALGASRSTVLTSVTVSAMRPLVVGIGIGWLIALGVTRLIRAQLFGIQSADLQTYVIVAVVLISAGLAAGYIPARRAIRADPLRALRAG